LLTSSRVARKPGLHLDADPRPGVTGLDGHHNLLRNRPHEGDELTRAGRDGDVRMLAARGESTKAFAQPDLRFPADVLNRLRQCVDPSLDVLGDFRWMAIRPSRLDQRATGAAVAGFGNAALATR